jgi:metal transporter CNNM
MRFATSRYTHSLALALLATVAHPSPLAPTARVAFRAREGGHVAPVDGDGSPQLPGANEMLCEIVIHARGCESTVDGERGAAPTRVADLCPEACARALASPRVAVEPASPVAPAAPAARRLGENATDEIWCLASADRTSFDLEECFGDLPENFPNEHARRIEKVNGAMAETSEEPLHWALAYGSTFILTCCSAFCSGLTLGLMGLDMTMIEVVKRSGSPKDKARAEKIEPIRKTGNQLLCMLLIGNTAVNAGLAITMADLAGGEWGFVVSTVLILIFGEITPQAICSRYGLAIGAALFWPIQICMWAFAPLSFPISKVLNAVLGKEIGLSYSREELIALLAMHSVGGQTKRGPQGDLSDMEAKILTGVLRFTEKTAGDVTTDIKYVQAVGMHEKLDLSVMNCIYRSGHSRIPVYEDEMANLVGILFVKDLIVIDPEDGVPVKDVVTYYNHNLPLVSKDLGLLSLLDEFIEGHSHMAVVTSATLEMLPDILANSPRQSQRVSLERVGSGATSTRLATAALPALPACCDASEPWDCAGCWVIHYWMACRTWMSLFPLLGWVGLGWVGWSSLAD